MALTLIELDFGPFQCEVELFNGIIAQRFLKHLPYNVNLVHWGKELYGPIGIDLGEAAPVSRIPPGGIAYTRQGQYVCIFFGQTPAWPVEHIGRIRNDAWQKLSETNISAVQIRMCSR